MSNATFHNFTDRDFVGYWNGKPKTVKAGETFHTQAWLAEHFAKHLTNRELILAGKETATSPKFPAQVPEFMDVFKKCYIPDAASGDAEANAFDATIAKTAEPSMDIAVKKPEPIDQGPAAAMAAQDSAPDGPPLIIKAPDDDEFDHGAK